MVEQQFQFVRTKNGWYIQLSNVHDIDLWDAHFNRTIYEHAATNLMEGKEYGNPGLSHGPYRKESSLSDYAFMRAKNNYELGLHPAAIAMQQLHIIRQGFLKTLKLEVEQHPVYVNKCGGYNTAVEEDDILEFVCDSKFPSEIGCEMEDIKVIL